MQNMTRNTVLTRLNNAPDRYYPERPAMPPLNEVSMPKEELIERFTHCLTEQTAVVYRISSQTDFLKTLETILEDESVSRLFLSEDELIQSLDIHSWAQKKNVPADRASDFSRKDSYKEALFNNADAGITGADMAVAESGTLIIAHSPSNARLISLAPVVHIAVVTTDRLVPVYEDAVEKVLSSGELPSQLTFITGPSLTADIQATPFRGMHGPKRLIVMLLDF